MKTENGLFCHGSVWLRADFHMHTKADKEFIYAEDENWFAAKYVSGLREAGIHVGVIANHNKFDMKEFHELRKASLKAEIYLLPGVELSVNDGSSGIHVIIVFSDQWIDQGNDRITPFIMSMFPGKTMDELQRENNRSDKSIPQVVDALNKLNRDYFLLFAHVEEKSGLWNEMSGTRIRQLFGDSSIRAHVLGFQKVRTHDLSERMCRKKMQDLLAGWYPAEVEGSDCKSIGEIGRGQSGYIKIGDGSFDAIKYALCDKEHRIAELPCQHVHSHILEARYAGGALDGQTLKFSPELNTVIGIRGSGKSAILEVLRYALEIPFGEKAGDQKYKQDLIGFALGSGGKIEIDAVDRHGQRYMLKRVWKEPASEVLINNILQPGISIRETIIHKPVYFGQKDLSSTGDGFEKDLVEKLLGSKLDDVRRRIEQQRAKVIDAIERLSKVSQVQEKMDEQVKVVQDAQHNLTIYMEHGVEEKLQKRLDFDSDIRFMEKGIQLATSFTAELEDLLARHEDDIRNYTGYASRHHAGLFDGFYKAFEIYLSLVNHLTEWLETEKIGKTSLLAHKADLVESRKAMVEEFAEIERKLAAELKDSGSKNISSEEFMNLKRKLAFANQLIAEYAKQGKQESIFRNTLFAELQKLNELWLEEFTFIKRELDKVGGDTESIKIHSTYQGDKMSFLSFMKDVFRGSGIREQTFLGIVDEYVDFVSMYRDMERAQKYFGSNPQTLLQWFEKNMKSLLTYQTPNQFKIMYHGKELKNHSLGQRASALILFVLNQKDNDLIMIDQPEDDLDNQTIYEDVIKLIRKIKPRVQFIFATHNPNIPVLGDADLVHACSLIDDKIHIESGSVDNHETQQTIVNIMEGGKEAFHRRKEIYQIWKP